jgi:hypothetical protein
VSWRRSFSILAMRTGSANAFASISSASSRPRSTDVAGTILFDRSSANVVSRSSIERSRASLLGGFTGSLIVREIFRPWTTSTVCRAPRTDRDSCYLDRRSFISRIARRFLASRYRRPASFTSNWPRVFFSPSPAATRAETAGAGIAPCRDAVAARSNHSSCSAVNRGCDADSTMLLRYV